MDARTVAATDEDRADGEAAEGRVGHDQHAGKSDRYRHAREENGAASGRAGRRNGIDPVTAKAALLAKSLDDEKRVVDADREPNHRDDEDDEVGHLHRVADQGGGARGDEDGEQCEDHWKAGGDGGAEDDKQDCERYSDADQLALRERFAQQRGHLAFDAPEANRRDPEPILAAGGIDQVNQRRGGIRGFLAVTFERHRDQDCVAVLRDETLCAIAVTGYGTNVAESSEVV